MPKVELIYYNITALGQPLRLLLAYGGEDWKDTRIEYSDWPNHKHKPIFKFGQMPVLIKDGKIYAQSMAIARYLGRKHGLAGADLEEDYLIDQHVDFINDIRFRAATVHYEQDEVQKAKLHEDYSKNVYPGMLDKLEQIIKENDGHLANGKLTWGDFVFAGLYSYIKKMMRADDLDSRYPVFKKLEETVYSIPRVKAYNDTAPKTVI